MSRSVLEKLLLAYIALIPIMVVRLPGLGSMIQLTELVFLALAGGWTVAWRRGEVRLPRLPAALGLGLFLLSATVSSLRMAGQFGVSHELPGYLYMVALFLISVSLLTPELWSRALRAWALTSTFVAAVGVTGVALGSLFGIQTPFALYYHSLFSIPFPLWRLCATFLTNPMPNMAMGYLLAGSILTWAYALKQRSPLWGLAALLHLTAAVLTFSRGWGALGLGLLVFLLQFRSLKAELVRWALILALVPMSLGVELISIWTVMHVHVGTVPVRETTGVEDPTLPEGSDVYLPGVPIRRFEATAEYVPITRTFLRQAEVELWREKPLFGWGPGNFGHELWRRQREEGERWFGFKVEFFKDPHSTLLGGLAELGLVGMGLLLYSLALIGKSLLRSLRRGPEKLFAWALLGVVVADLCFSLNCDMMTMRWFWMALALAQAAPQEQHA